MARVGYANVHLTPGRGEARTIHAPEVESWSTEQAIDNDVDSFSVDLGDVANRLIDALDRDTEVRVDLFCDDHLGKVRQVFAGLVDVDTLATSKTHTMQGGDVPSSVLIASDALFGYWRHVDPRPFLLGRAKTFGLTDVQVSPMRQIGRLWSDSSEKEWSFWYRVARMGGCYMWSTSTGTLVVDGLAYSATTFSYSFGDPPRGEARSRWIQVEDVSLVSNKQQRIGKAVVYGEDKKKKGVVPVAVATNARSTSIANWRRRPTTYSTLTTARTQKELDDEAKLDVFESIVGAQEYTLTIRDDRVVEQNTMARVNLPDYGLVGHYYVVGVSRDASESGMTQQVRLRERQFALDKRVPTAPSLTKQPNTAADKSVANIAQGIEGVGGAKWYRSFVRATREFLSGPNTQGWDFSLALGVLLSICEKETHFKNIREISGRADAYDDVGWYQMPTHHEVVKNPSSGADVVGAGTAGSIVHGIVERGSPTGSLAGDVQRWRKTFANSAGNPLNPFGREAGVGPMQLTSTTYKGWADDFGWSRSTSGAPSGGVEYAGGRWFYDSNIRAAAKALAEKARAVGADPTNSGTIWAAVKAYNGAGQAAQNYADDVKKIYDSTFKGATQSAVSSAQGLPTGSAQRSFRVSPTDTITLPDNAPNEVAKAITWIMSQRGNPYLYGGTGPNYDCSSLVTMALVVGDSRLKNVLSYPRAGNHGETTFTLKDKGNPVAKNDLLPGDLVFFNGVNNGAVEPWGHVGMFVGDGQFVQDPHTGDVVKVSGLNEDYYRENYLGARRFFTWYPKASG